MSGVKELALILWHLQLIDQLNRFFALQALVEHLGICIATFGLKFPILLNWVKFRPGIWDGGATSSTGRGAADNSPTLGCFGLAPSRLSKQWGMDILPIFLLRLGSSRLIVDHLLGLVWWLEKVLCQLCWSPQWKEEGDGNPCSVSVWQMLSTWSVLWLSRLEPWRFLQYMRSYIHLLYTPSDRLDPSFGHWRSCPLGASALTSGCWLPLKHTCTGVYLKIFLKDSLNPGK